MPVRRPLPFALLLGLAVACRGGDPKPAPDGGGDGGADGGADGGGPDTGDTGAPAPSDDPVEELLAALDASSAAPVQVQTERGRITWIDVDLPLPAGDDPFAAARAAIGPWAEIWHVRDPDRELVPARKVEDPSIGTAGVWFAVHVGGVPIYGAEVGVFAQDGRALQLVGNVPRALVSAGWITLSDGTLAYYDPSLFGGPEAGPRLSWMIRAWSEERGGGLAFVDADTGELVGFSAEERDWAVSVNSALGSMPGQFCWAFVDDDTWIEDDDHSYSDWPGPSVDPFYEGPTVFEHIHSILN